LELGDGLINVGLLIEDCLIAKLYSNNI
jgi:hypothetical protein